MTNVNNFMKTVANILLPLTKAGVEKAIDNDRNTLKVGVEVDVETGETSATITDIKTQADWAEIERLARLAQGKSENEET